MKTGRKVLIVGGGIGGLSTALSLHQRGIPCEVVELREKWDVYHVGIGVSANFLRAMSSLNIAKRALAAGHVFKGMIICDVEGRERGRAPSAKLSGDDGEEFPGDLGLTRPALHEILTSEVKAKGIEVRLGITFTEITDLSDRVSVRFTDGSQRDYELVVGADGAYSKVRGWLFGDRYVPTYTGQGVFRYNIPRPKDCEWGVLHKGKPGAGVGYLPLTNETMYVFHVGAEPGNPRFAPESLACELRSRLEGFGGRIPAIRDQIVAPELVVYRPLEVCVVREPWFRGRVMILGDAAHSATPHVGQGAAMAVEDAVVLGEEFERGTDISDVLNRFWARRHERVFFVADSAIQLGKWEQHPSPEANSHQLIMEVFKRVAEPI